MKLPLRYDQEHEYGEPSIKRLIDECDFEAVAAALEEGDTLPSSVVTEADAACIARALRERRSRLSLASDKADHWHVVVVDFGVVSEAWASRPAKMAVA